MTREIQSVIAFLIREESETHLVHSEFQSLQNVVESDNIDRHFPRFGESQVTEENGRIESQGIHIF